MMRKEVTVTTADSEGVAAAAAWRTARAAAPARAPSPPRAAEDSDRAASRGSSSPTMIRRPSANTGRAAAAERPFVVSARRAPRALVVADPRKLRP